MSDFCAGCRFDPKRDCPITRLYWAFLDRHRERLRGNPRLEKPLAASAARPLERRQEDARVFERVSEALTAGRVLTPASIAP